MNQVMSESIASLSLDLDNKWSYMKTHGDPGWETYPSYLDIVVPRILGILEELNLSITFFIVGQDAALQENHDALKAIVAEGHEIGNHSFNHEPWLHLYSEDEINIEVSRAEKHIQLATGVKPVGFRGPGYSLSAETLNVLAKRNYLYDASTFPTFIGPLARIYYFLKADQLDQDQRGKRNLLFGKFTDGLRPNKTYWWKTDYASILEIPVTTMPILKIPFHISYILYMSSLSFQAAMVYMKTALYLCSLTNTQPSLLLHPLDILGCDDVEGLDFFPGMNLSSQEKIQRVTRILMYLKSHFSVLPLREHALYLSRLNQRRVIAYKP